MHVYVCLCEIYVNILLCMRVHVYVYVYTYACEYMKIFYDVAVIEIVYRKLANSVRSVPNEYTYRIYIYIYI